MTGRVSVAAVVVALVGLAGCADSASPTAGDASSDGAAAPIGTAYAAGPSSCPAAFLDDDGVCLPSAETCAPDELPSMTSGCVPVGVVGCADVFAVDGRCEPTAAACPPDHVPHPLEGCRPAGPLSCAGPWLDGATQACGPRLDRCSAGAIPTLSAGCVAVGPAACGAAFVRPEDGACVPDPGLCAVDELLVPSLGCVSLAGSAACGDATFPDVGASAQSALYVDGSVASGDGSREAPFATLQAALAAADPGATIVLAAGQYAAPGTLTRDVALWGRCASMVTLSGVAPALPGFPASIHTSSASVTVVGVTLRGDGLGAVASSTGVLTLRDVILDQSREAALHAAGTGASITGEQVLIRDTRGLAFPDGRGANAELGATITLHRSTLLRAVGVAVRASGTGSRVVLDDCAVADTRAPSGLTLGHGLIALGGGRIEAGDSTITDGVASAATALDSGSQIDLLRSVVDRSGTGGGGLPAGVLADQGGSVSVRRSVISRNSATGVQVVGSSSLLVEESIIRETAEYDGFGAGGLAVGGGVLTLQSVVLYRNAATGLAVTGAGSGLSCAGCLIEASQPVVAGQGELSDEGAGAIVQDGGRLELQSSFVRDCTSVGVHAEGVGATLSVSASTVSDTAGDPTAGHASGQGILVERGAVGTLLDVVLAGNRDANLSVRNGGSVDAEGVLLLDARASPVAPAHGLGLLVDSGGSATISGLAALGNHGFGAAVSGPESVLNLTGFAVLGTLPDPSGQAGQGLRADLGARLVASDGVVADSRHSGVSASGAGTRVALSRADVRRTRPDSSGGAGTGVSVFGADLEMVDVDIEDNVRYGVYASGGVLGATRLLVRDTLPIADGELAYGVLATDGAALTLRESAALRNVGVGILMDTDNGTPQGTVDLSGVVVAGTVSPVDGGSAAPGGVGIVVQGPLVSVRIAECAVVDNVAAGLFVLEASVTIATSVLTRGRTGRLTASIHGVGDGLFAVGSDVALHAVRVTDNERAGVFLQDSTAALAGCLSSSNALGLVLQGASFVELTADTAVERNATNRLEDGAFEVPREAVAIPPPPSDPGHL